ncbi:MAG: isochorismatase [Calditrichaeota bacterium]|nr:MAG: isochorismatase [Calditrichota bacterium]
MRFRELPIPTHFQPERVGEVWKVDYEAIATAAREWSREHSILPTAEDRFRVALLLVDVQNTFCIPGFELFVGGPSGQGAVEDNRRLCEFIYRHLSLISRIIPTMDTHQAMQIFHSIFFVNENGEHPAPYTLISGEDIRRGKWRFNTVVAHTLNWDAEYIQEHLEHYTAELEKSGKYTLTVWPYHAMLGGIGHALVPAVEEAIFFHSIARYTQPDIQMKGSHPLTENYSVLGPEVATGPDGRLLATKNESLIQRLIDCDAVIVAGQAKSHCVAWTVADLLDSLEQRAPDRIERVYLLEDCTSPVVVPGVIDYTEAAEAAYRRFAEAGMRVVRSTDPIREWPGVLGEKMRANP